MTLNALELCVNAARSIVSDQGNGRVRTLGEIPYKKLYPLLDPAEQFAA